MNCSEVTELLSVYYDDELPPDKHSKVAGHLMICTACAAKLEAIQSLSELTSQLDQPTPPRYVWWRIEAQLDKSALTVVPAVLPMRNGFRKMLVILSVLLLIGLTVATYTQWRVHHDDHLAMDFSRFVDTFQQAPDEAQMDLVKKYNGRPIEIVDSIRILKYRPAVADGLPPDYEPFGTYLLKMPCCECLEACYRNENGGMLCVFEHDKDQPVWFGERQASIANFSGKRARLVQVENWLAATWPHQSRYITVIGAEDIDEVTQLVAHFEQPTAISNP